MSNSVNMSEARIDVDKEMDEDITLEQGTKTDKKRSKVWEHYQPYVENGKKRAKCIHCKVANYLIGSGSHGTSNLKKHLEKCLQSGLKNAGPMIIDKNLSLRSPKIDQNVYREKMAIAIIKHNYPFSMVEHDGTRDLHSYLNPTVKAYTRNTAEADCLKIYKREMEKLKLALKSVPSRICLTSNVWSSITTEGYISLTAHFVDENWTLHSKILNFSLFPPPHNGVFLAENVLKFLKEWEIEKRIFSITLDDASGCTVMQELLKEQMKGNLLCNGAYFHIRCPAHILNLIVQDGLGVANEALKKIRESVKYISGSEGRLIRFFECCGHLGVKIEMSLRLDVPTRWNSTYLMLKSAIRYRKVFAQYALIDLGYIYNPREDEWDGVDKICNFLKPFFEITTLLSGSEYPTANLYFQSVWKIQLRLIEELRREDGVLKDMANEMKPKFDKYWESYSVVLAMAIVLDPRYKMVFVKFCYDKIDENKSGEKVKKVKEALVSLYEEYVKHSSKWSNISIVDPQSSTIDTSQIFEDETSEFDILSERLTSSRSDLDIYLDEPLLNHRQHPHLEILKWWKNHCARFPILSMMARDLMSIPITTVASESTFSIGAKVLTKCRSSLTSENAEALICTRNWLCGYQIESEELTDDELMVPMPTTESGDSNSTLI